MRRFPPDFFKRLAARPHLAAVSAVILTALLVFATAIPRLGYYHDDWYMLWSAALRGPASLVTLFSTDRPFMGVIYWLTYRVIGDSIPAWHGYALAWRAAGALAFYAILNLMWPGRARLHGLAALLFLLYPGYLSQPNAATKINHLIGFGAALFSIALSLLAARAPTARRARLYTALSLPLTALYLWLYEYMIGLEIMRLALLFWLAWQGKRAAFLPALKKTLRAYLPYALAAAAFLFWRVFLFRSIRPSTDLKGLVVDYYTQPLAMALRLVVQTLKDFFSAGLFAWLVQPYYLVTRAGYSQLLGALGLLSGAVLVALGYLRWQPPPAAADAEEDPSPALLLGLGALITLGAVFPVVLSNKFLNLMDPYKSYGLHPSPGVILLILGALGALRSKYRTPVFLALIALSAAAQSLNNQDWIRYWDAQKNFWWQMTWRAPGLQENTLLMAYLPAETPFQQDYEVWGPASLIYYPLPDIVPAIQSEVLNGDTLFEVYKGELTDPYVRDIFMPRDFGNLLLVSQPTPSACIHAVDGQMLLYSAAERPLVELAGPYSDLRRIDPFAVPPVPPAAIFGKEPAHGWCYYYQKAALARQSGDWAAIGALYDAARAGGFQAGDRFEYFVFVEGLVNSGRTAEAAALAQETLRGDERTRLMVCRGLAAAPDYPEEFGYRRAEIQTLVCGE